MRAAHRGRVGEIEQRDLVPDRVDIMAEGGGAGPDMVLEGHEVPDRGRAWHRRPEPDVGHGQHLQGILHGPVAGRRKALPVVPEQADQVPGAAEPADLPVVEQPDMLPGVSRGQVGGPAHWRPLPEVAPVLLGWHGSSRLPRWAGEFGTSRTRSSASSSSRSLLKFSWRLPKFSWCCTALQGGP